MHTNPEVLALLALAEDVGTPAERLHIESCPACSEGVAELARIADVGRSSTASDLLSAPSPEVWARITAELGFDAPARLRSGAPAGSGPSPAATTTPDATVTDLAARRVPADPGGERPTSATRR